MATLTQLQITQTAWEKLPIGIHETGEIYSTQKELANELGVGLSSLNVAIKKKRKLYGLTIYKITDYKFCCVCKELKSIDKFRKRKYTNNLGLRIRYASKCKKCEAMSRTIYNKHNRDKVRNTQRSWQIRNRYGLSREEYENLLKQQNNKCAICKKPFKSTPHIDHDHDTNRIRGLLCYRCNTAIGSFKENIMTLKSAIRYLNDRKGEFLWPA